MQLTYFGHSCFSVAIKDKVLLFDPFITYNELANSIVEVDTVKADYILLSHGHIDHIADCVRIAARTNAKVICNWEIHEWLIKQGITNTHPLNTGGKWPFPDFTVKAVTAHHSSGLPDGSYGGSPLGFIVTSEDGNFYYSGDTALTLDMQLIPRWAKLNFAVLPIGDNFTMDASDAAECARMIGCNTIIGVHFDTFIFIKINHEEAVRIFENAGLKLQLLPIGTTISI
ncbi:MAG TPA: metal-dependent hydrolase [Flavitalea sp.]|nr:metal-dependent hydrolase [Flavitalea sp.]